VLMPGGTLTPKRAWERESRHCWKAGRAAVLADARALPVCRLSSHGINAAAPDDRRPRAEARTRLVSPIRRLLVREAVAQTFRPVSDTQSSRLEHRPTAP
jgi:hypothetical protein